MQYQNTVNNMASKLLFGLLLGAVALSAQAKMYKWTDAQGNVHYTDTLPPSAAAQGNAELSKTGNVVSRTESAEERRKRLVVEAEARELQKQKDEQLRKDRALLSTYTTEKEIDLARDRALEHHKLAIESAQSRLSQLEPSLKELDAKVAGLTKAKKPVPSFLKQQYESKQAEVAEAKNTIKSNQDSMLEVRTRYEEEKLRFRELTAKR